MHCCVNHLTCFVTLDLYDTCLVPSTVRLPLPTAPRQCDNLPFIKFTTYCPLNPILDATKINPLKFRACVAIRDTHYDEHFVQFVTAVCGPKSPLTTRRSLDWRTNTAFLLPHVLTLSLSPYFLHFISWLWNAVPRGILWRSVQIDYESEVYRSVPNLPGYIWNNPIKTVLCDYKGHSFLQWMEGNKGKALYQYRAVSVSNLFHVTVYSHRLVVALLSQSTRMLRQYEYIH